MTDCANHPFLSLSRDNKVCVGNTSSPHDTTHHWVGLKLAGVENAPLGPGAREGSMHKVELVIRANNLQGKIEQTPHIIKMDRFNQMSL